MSPLRSLGFGLSAFGLTGTVAPLLPYDDWWIRGWDYPRGQLLAILAGAAAALTARRSPPTYAETVVLGLVAAAATYQAARILPYTPFWRKQLPDAAQGEGASFKLLVSNVLQSNRAYGRLLDLVREQRPDVLLTLESDHRWEAVLDAALAEDYPHAVRVPQTNRYGMHLYARLLLRNTSVHYLIRDDIPSVTAQIQLDDGRWIDFYAVHPAPPSPTEEYASTGRDAELAVVGRHIEERGKRSTIVAGDLNDVAWSPSTRLFQRLSGLLDPRRGRGLFATFHADYWWMRWPLDHVFVSDDFRVEQLQRLRHIGSDHFPVSLTVRHRPGEKGHVSEPAATAEEEREADEKVAHARAGGIDGAFS